MIIMKKNILIAMLLLSNIFVGYKYFCIASPKPVNSISHTEGKMIIGEEEYCFVEQADASIAARIDTGAALSSITATNIKHSERGGKKLVEFDIAANDRIIHVAAPFIRNIDIRQSSRDMVQWRPTAELTIVMGDLKATEEFSLVNRERMNYPLMLGRNVLRDRAIVDVSKSFNQKRYDQEGLLILTRDQYKENIKNNINVNQNYDQEKLQKAKMSNTPYNYTGNK